MCFLKIPIQQQSSIHTRKSGEILKIKLTTRAGAKHLQQLGASSPATLAAVQAHVRIDLIDVYVAHL